jgi:hypothetical protein
LFHSSQIVHDSRFHFLAKIANRWGLSVRLFDRANPNNNNKPIDFSLYGGKS